MNVSRASSGAARPETGGGRRDGRFYPPRPATSLALGNSFARASRSKSRTLDTREPANRPARAAFTRGFTPAKLAIAAIDTKKTCDARPKNAGASSSHAKTNRPRSGGRAAVSVSMRH